MRAQKKQHSEGEAKALAWFEEAILAQTPKQSILDTASLGIWSIAEQSGLLAGVWKRHRASMEELDPDLISTIMGELLMAIVQMTNAIGMDLETIMDRQIERIITVPMKKGARSAQPRVAKNGVHSAQPEQGTQKKSSALKVVPSRTEAKSVKLATQTAAPKTRKPPQKTATVASKVNGGNVATSGAPPVLTKRGSAQQQTMLDRPVQSAPSAKKRTPKSVTS